MGPWGKNRGGRGGTPWARGLKNRGWRDLGPLGTVLRVLGVPWRPLGGVLWASWKHLGRILGRLRASWRPLGAPRRRLGASWGRLGLDFRSKSDLN